jgi:ribosome-associated protein
MSDDSTTLVINDRIAIPLSELEFNFVRSSGPGGQNVNKVNSQAQLAWNLAETEALPGPVLERFKQAQRGRITKEDVFRLDSQRFRDREKNRQDCLDRLREMVADAVVPPKRRKKTRIPKRAHERRLQEKRQRAQRKQERRGPKLDD